MNHRAKKMLQTWSAVPNPTEEFFYRNNVHPQKALRDITYTPEVEAAIITRESAVISDRWQIIGDDKHIVDIVSKNIRAIRPSHIFRSILEAIWYGYSVLEHPLIYKNGSWYYEKISSLPCEWFRFDKDKNLIVNDLLEEYNTTPIIHANIGDLNKEVELVQYRSSYTNPYGESQLARVFWSATWLRGDMELWANYIDRFGDDAILARTEISSPQKRQELLQAILDFRSSGGMVVEGTDEFSIMKSEKSTSSDLFKNFHEVCVKQINKLILGHASALDSTPGKLGNEQNISHVRHDITRDDKTLIKETMNNLIKHLCLVNEWNEVEFIWSPEEEDESLRIERDQKIMDMGFELSADYMRKTYNFSVEDLTKKDTV